MSLKPSPSGESFRSLISLRGRPSCRDGRRRSLARRNRRQRFRTFKPAAGLLQASLGGGCAPAKYRHGSRRAIEATWRGRRRLARKERRARKRGLPKGGCDASRERSIVAGGAGEGGRRNLAPLSTAHANRWGRSRGNGRGALGCQVSAVSFQPERESSGNFWPSPLAREFCFCCAPGGPLLKSRKIRLIDARRTRRRVYVSQELRRLSHEFAEETFATFGKEAFAAKLQKSTARRLAPSSIAARRCGFGLNYQRTDASIRLRILT